MTKYQVKFTNQFQKSRKRMGKRGLDLNLLDDIVSKLSNGIPLEAKFVDHRLSGDFKGFRECHILSDWLQIYLVEGDTLTLIETGSHSDLF